MNVNQYFLFCLCVFELNFELVHVKRELVQHCLGEASQSVCMYTV